MSAISRLVCALLLGGGLMLEAQASLANSAGSWPSVPEPVKPEVLSGDESGWQMVRITYRDRADLDRLAAWLDVWEVHPEVNLLVARVSQVEYEQLLSAGYSVMVDTAHYSQPFVAPGSCYRTVDQLYADQDILASTHPTLTEVITIGTSYEGRALCVFKLTNKSHDVPGKPRFFLMANIHGREFITPEAAMQFIKRLLEGYGHAARHVRRRWEIRPGDRGRQGHIATFRLESQA
jgi:hypothetical protein